MIQPRPKLLTFDCYGTPTDRASDIRAYFGEVLTERNVGVDPETFCGRWYERQLEEISGPFKPYREVLQVRAEHRVPRGRRGAATACGGVRSRVQIGRTRGLDRPFRDG